jgi:hypothetical protein
MLIPYARDVLVIEKMIEYIEKTLFAETAHNAGVSDCHGLC